jgi:hypothetical protein
VVSLLATGACARAPEAPLVGSATSSGARESSSAGTGPPTSGTSAGSNAGGSSGGGTTGPASTSGTTNGRPGPYVGYDAGPLWEPPIDIDAGCTAILPVFDPSQQHCVQCVSDADCHPGLLCDKGSCGICSSVDNRGCAPGELCSNGTFYPNGCVPNCLDAGDQICNPGLCLFNGFCEPGACQVDADCTTDAGGACDQSGCVACLDDGGGCTQPGDLCSGWFSSYRFCQPSCLTDSTVCDPGSPTAGYISQHYGYHGALLCASFGVCISGCKAQSDCGGDTPLCDLKVGYCVQCVLSYDCPDYAPGCRGFDCGMCGTDADCGGQHCDLGYCSCHADSECPRDAPICIGLDGGTSYIPVCGCTDSSQCQAGTVCESREPHTRSALPDNSGFGGVCIPRCDTPGGTACPTSGIGDPGTPNADVVCEPDTGYCVQCATDSDCASNLNTPNCLLLDGGVDGIEYGAQFADTGGGICGCAATSDCFDGETCGPSKTGASGLFLWGGSECVQPCGQPGGPNACFAGAPLCDSWTGLCRQCLSDYFCTGFTSSANGAPTSWCEPDSGTCLQCASSVDCPENLPGCSTAPDTFGSCGFCRTVQDCPSDAGYACLEAYSQPQKQCLSPCVAGETYGSVSDAGPPCPFARPYCVTAIPIAEGTVCVQCISDLDCDSGYCTGVFCHSYPY